MPSLLILPILLTYLTLTAANNQTQPITNTQYGLLRGLSHAETHTESFLGIPYAEPPVDDLRFRHPRPWTRRWRRVRDATTFGSSCPGYAGFSEGLVMSEDCLSVNVVRPENGEGGRWKGKRGHEKGLPVLLWIHGGGFTGGGSSDPRYDMRSLVHQSIEIGKPIIAVSINYRLAVFGFLAGNSHVEDFNMGLWDQRVAMEWVRNNIVSFGGDPEKITIWGESAGAFSVGFHTLLSTSPLKSAPTPPFRAVILESGTAFAPGVRAPDDTIYQSYYNNITQTLNCFNASNTLQCLREASYDSLYKAAEPFVFSPVLDGERGFIPRLPSEMFTQGEVEDVSMLVGANTDEGTAEFWGLRGTLNSDGDVAEYISKLGNGLPEHIVKGLMALYSDDPAQGAPYETGEEQFADQGTQYKRGAAIAGDWAVIAGRRQTALYYSNHPNPRTHHSGRPKSKSKVYSYRFDQAPWNGIMKLIATTRPVGATHFSEIGSVFNNSYEGLTTWVGPGKEFGELSGLMCRAWVSFVWDLNPNGHGVRGIPHWPEYSQQQKNIVFRTDRIWIEKDDFRKEQLEYWGKIWKLLLT